MLTEDYIPVAVFTIIAIAFPLLTFSVTRLFRPYAPSRIKTSTYECGETPFGEAQIQFHFQYYMYAIIFVVFDVVTIFFLLWAYTYADLGLGAKILMGLFAGILMLGVYYALKKEEKIWI